MSSRNGVLLGAQVPPVAAAPSRVRGGDGPDACQLATGYGLRPDPWQASVVEAWMGHDRRGQWAATQAGLSVPRQNGKNVALEIRELFGMLLLGEKFLHSAHEVKTTRKAFKRLKGFFGEKAGDPAAAFPELNALVAEVRSTNGQEAIVLGNGGSVEFAARSSGSGRGFTVDVLVLDEAQHLSDDELEAMLATISSPPLGNPQTLFTGTPPGPNVPGQVWARQRNASLTGTVVDRAWHEWSLDVPASRVRDFTDDELTAAAAATNPALGRRITMRTVRTERTQLTAEGFARERLGIWPASSSATAVDLDRWRDGAVDTAPTGRPAFAIDMSPDRSVIALGAGIKTRPGVFGELVQHQAVVGSLDWVVDWLAARRTRSVGVVVDRHSPAMVLVPALEARRVKVTVTGASELAAAFGMWADGVKAGTFTHWPQPVVDAAVGNLRRRRIGDAGGWGPDRRDPEIDITPAVAIVLAAWLAATARTRSRRLAY